MAASKKEIDREALLVGLRLRDVRLDGPATVTLYGKGRKSRVVPLMRATASREAPAIAAWAAMVSRRPSATRECVFMMPAAILAAFPMCAINRKLEKPSSTA